jgi:hypothetical protein
MLNLFMNYFNTVAPMVHQSSLPNCMLKAIILRSPCSFTKQKITRTKIAYFSKIYCHISFQDPVLSSASVASLLDGTGLKCMASRSPSRTEFHKNLPIGSNVIRGDRQTDT